MLQNESSSVLLEKVVNSRAGKSIPAADRIAPAAVECNSDPVVIAALLPRRISTGNLRSSNEFTRLRA
jgi:hypothetical protein